MGDVRKEPAVEAETVSLPPAAPPGDAVTVTAGGSAPPVGERPSVPGYELFEELGRGGMGVVFKARQQSLNRFVALKMILAGPYAGADQRARFRIEAESVARLQHPGIVQIYEIGNHAGHSFLALEYVPGGTLASRCDGRPWRSEKATSLIESLARAVQYAHRRGVVHRDLKPGNVLLTEEGQPKIADFGLAKMLDADARSPGSGLQTQSGAILGTPAYMAPEQTGGKRGSIGPGVDIYALGAILYELLTGRPPFQAESTVDLILRVANEEPLPPRQMEPGIPRDLEAVCLKCLQKDSARRYPSAGALADDLRRFLDGEPTTARPPSRGARFRRWARRRRGWLVAGGVVSCLLLLLIASLALNALALIWGSGTVRMEGGGPPVAETGAVTDTKMSVTKERVVLPKDRKTTPDAKEEYDKVTSYNNLKQLALGLIGYEDAHGRLPPAAIMSKDGKPLLSWRVTILQGPGLGELELYKEFKLDEPWDSEHNKKLLGRMPKCFAPPRTPPGYQPNTTFYQVFTGKETIFPPGQSLCSRDILDGTSNTLLIVEAFEAVPWTKPADLPYDPAAPLPQLGGIFRDGFQAVMADGSSGTFLPKDIDPVKLRALITPRGGEVVKP